MKAAALAGIVMSTNAHAWTERDIALGTEAAALHGTLTLPDGAAPVPAALVIAGSGPVDRDGNLPGMANDSLKLLAHGLADNGIASLRTDKRGIGASQAAGPREEDLRFGTYVSDAVAWAGVLRTQPEVARVVLIGHSEGALVATLAAQQADVDGLVLIAGAGEPAGKLILRQLAQAGVPETVSCPIVAALEDGQRVADIPPALAPIFRPSVQPYLTSWLPLDPLAELGKVRTPVLIVQGTTDLQVTVDDARHLASVTGTSPALIEGMNHVLKRAPADTAANLATYADPGLPLAPDLIPVMTAFIKRYHHAPG